VVGENETAVVFTKHVSTIRFPARILIIHTVTYSRGILSQQPAQVKAIKLLVEVNTTSKAVKNIRESFTMQIRSTAVTSYDILES
jgi:hypothetical protein